MKKSIVLFACLLFSVTAYYGFAGGKTQAPAQTGKAPTVLRVGIPDLPEELDPTHGITGGKARLIFNIFDQVMYKDATRNSELTSLILESWKMIDEFTTEFKLKQGITFHNGDPMTAEDIKYSIDRILNGSAGTQRNIYATVESVQVVDTYTVRIKTSQPDLAIFARLASSQGVYVVPKNYMETVGAEKFAQAPVGSGPFKVTSFSPEKLTLEYYEGYYGKRPVINTVECLMFPEAATRITALITGELDIALVLGPDNKEQINAVPGLRFESRRQAGFQLLQYNASVPPMDDVNLRRALNVSIDRKLLVETLWGGLTTIPNGYNYPDFGEYYIKDYPEYEYNVNKAKQFLAASKYKGEPIIYELQSGYYPLGNEVAEAIVSMWQSIGINARVEFSDVNRFDKFHVRNWSNNLRFEDPVGGIWLQWGPNTNPFRYYWKESWDELARLGNILQISSDFETRYDTNRKIMELWDYGHVAGTVLYNSADFYAVRDNIEWKHPSMSTNINFRGEYFSFK
jgi:peptide/nickel transport system substrate-binding protein